MADVIEFLFNMNLIIANVLGTIILCYTITKFLGEMFER